MTAIKERAIEIIEKMPDERLYYVVNILDNIESLSAMGLPDRKTEAQIAFQELEKYRKKGALDRDYKKELYEALREKYEGTD